MWNSVFALIFALNIFAVSGQAQANTPDIEADGEPPRCVSLRNINGYTVLARQHLILKGSASRHYLVTLRSRCFGLNSGAKIGTSFSDNARLCRPYVAHIKPEGGGRCTIDMIEEIADREAAEALIQRRSSNTSASQN